MVTPVRHKTSNRPCRAEEPFRRSHVTGRAQHRVDEMPIAIDGPIQIAPLAMDLQVGVSRPREFHPRPLVGRVEDWRAGPGRGVPTMPRFQPPPRRTQRADFPHCAPPFASCRGLWDLSCWGDFRPVASHSIGAEQPESVVQPRLTPSSPAEALSFPGMRQMAPDLLLHPIFDEAEALA